MRCESNFFDDPVLKIVGPNYTQFQYLIFPLIFLSVFTWKDEIKIITSSNHFDNIVFYVKRIYKKIEHIISIFTL